jgi:hypothetical protein
VAVKNPKGNCCASFPRWEDHVSGQQLVEVAE